MGWGVKERGGGSSPTSRTRSSSVFVLCLCVCLCLRRSHSRYLYQLPLPLPPISAFPSFPLCSALHFGNRLAVKQSQTKIGAKTQKKPTPLGGGGGHR